MPAHEFHEEWPEDEPEVILDVPMSPTELAEIRKHRGNPEYVPAGQVKALHQGWTDTEIILLGPLFTLAEGGHAPALHELLRVTDDHPAKLARPGSEYYGTCLAVYARYCLRAATADSTQGWEELAKALLSLEMTSDEMDSVRQKVRDSLG